MRVIYSLYHSNTSILKIGIKFSSLCAKLHVKVLNNATFVNYNICTQALIVSKTKIIYLSSLRVDRLH